MSIRLEPVWAYKTSRWNTSFLSINNSIDRCRVLYWTPCPYRWRWRVTSPAHCEHEDVMHSTVSHWRPLPAAVLCVPPPDGHKVSLGAGNQAPLHSPCGHAWDIMVGQLGGRWRSATCLNAHVLLFLRTACKVWGTAFTLGSCADIFSSFLPESDCVSVRGVGTPLDLLPEKDTHNGRQSSTMVRMTLLSIMIPGRRVKSKSNCNSVTRTINDIGIAHQTTQYLLWM